MDMYAALYQKGQEQLKNLRNIADPDSISLQEKLEQHGISRRDFMKWCSSMAATLALPFSFTPTIAEAAELANRVPVIWLNFAECTGCSESFLRSTTPTVSTLIFQHISLAYQETLMAASGFQAEEALSEAIEKNKGKYLLVVEGAVPTANHGMYLTIGANAQTSIEILENAAKGAMGVIAVGTCSSFGGVQAAAPNPTGAKGIHKILKRPVINISGCPPNDVNITGTLMYYIMFAKLPALDLFNRPKWAYGSRVHDNCDRRGHFDAGEFVEEFSDHNAEQGYCLYKMGCRGPYTYNNCPTKRFNSHTSWPVQAGHGCIGCSEPDFWDTMADFEQPLASKKLLKGLDASADTIGAVTLGLTVLGIGAHAIATIFARPYKEEDDE